MNFSLYDRSKSSKDLKRIGLFNNQQSTLELPLIGSTSRENFSFKTFDIQTTKNKPLINSPDNSQYNIKSVFPTRPVTCNLSGLTLKENEKFQLISNSVISYTEPRLKMFSEETPKLPSEKDFEKILNKLELVASNKNTGHRRILLLDSDPSQILLEKGAIQYFTIKCLNKKPPLLINIHKKRGLTVAYLSRITPEPNKLNCDFSFSKESYYVKDVGIKFKNENFFLAIEAVTDCDCSIIITFGKKPPKKKIALKFEEIMDDSLLDSCKNSNLKKLGELKDFIKINKTSFKLKSAWSSRTNDWDKRREMAISKKIQNIETKKQKTIHTIHKNEIKREAEKRKREETEKMVLVQRQQKFWISVIYFYVYVDQIKAIVNKARTEKLEKIRKSFQVKRIQRVYRDSLGMSSEVVNLSRAANLLKLCFYSTKPVFSLQLVKCVKESAQNFILPKAFMRIVNMFNLMKRLWRDHMKKMKTGMEALIRQWNSVIEEQLLKNSKSTIKRRKSQELINSNSIPMNERNRILAQHILTCKIEYLKSVRDYRESKKRMLESVISKFKDIQEYHKLNYSRAPIRRTSNNQLQKSDYPTLNIIPTNAYMLKLIQKAYRK